MGSNWFRRNPDNTVTDMGPHWSPSNEERERTLRVALTNVGEYEISTVFLYADCSFGDDATPILWETLIMGSGPWQGEGYRYETYDEAVAGHERFVQAITDSLETDRRIRALRDEADALAGDMIAQHRPY